MSDPSQRKVDTRVVVETPEGVDFQFVIAGPGSRAYAWLIARAGVLLRRPRIGRAFDAVTGSILVALGVRLASEPQMIEG